MKINIKNMWFLLLIVMSPLLHAEACDEFSVAFMVEGTDRWEGMSPLDILQRESATSTSSSTDKNSGVMLKDLVSPHAKQGTLIIYSCGGKNKNLEVADLLSGVAEKSGYFLTLSRKNFFKLVNTNNSKPVLKKIYRLKLVP